MDYSNKLGKMIHREQTKALKKMVNKILYGSGAKPKGIINSKDFLINKTENKSPPYPTRLPRCVLDRKSVV